MELSTKIAVDPEVLADEIAGAKKTIKKKRSRLSSVAVDRTHVLHQIEV